MNLTTRKPHDPVNGGLTRLRDELDRTFDRFLDEPLGMMEPTFSRAEGWIPPLDVSEDDTNLTVRAEIPGMSTDDLEVSVQGDMLSIAGRKEECEEKKGADYYRSERRFGSFRRLIELPSTADLDKIVAEADNGLLTVRIAKKPGLKPRQIKVKPVSKKVSISG